MEFMKLLWFSLLFNGAGVCAIQTLQNIEDLKHLEFGHKYPRHGLLLLHWLAEHISIRQTGDIQLHFNPARRDYGFQLYPNTQHEQKTALPHLEDSLDRAYYSLGSLSSETTRTKLPPYVTQDFYNFHKDPNRDLDRIVIRIHKSISSRADKVYITQAMTDKQNNVYDQNKTYEIGLKLLRQVQALQKPLDIVQVLLPDGLNSSKTPSDDPRLALTKDQLLTHLQHNVKRLETIFEQAGVRWLLSLAGYDIDGRYEVHKRTWLCSTDEPVQRKDDPETLCESLGPVNIHVKSTSDGYARIMWSGIPKNIIELGPVIVLFRSDSLETFESLKDKTSGSANTYVALNQGLQPRLITYNFGNGHGFIGIRYSAMWSGPEFDEANRVVPTEITGYNASLQLYTRQGYACARLYIKKSFTNWKDEFHNSWVGFYTSELDSDSEYQHYQWVTKFKKVSDKDDTKEYLIYQYESPLSIAPGLQARFLFSEEVVRSRILLGLYSPTVKARTVPWEKEE